MGRVFTIHKFFPSKEIEGAVIVFMEEMSITPAMAIVGAKPLIMAARSSWLNTSLSFTSAAIPAAIMKTEPMAQFNM